MDRSSRRLISHLCGTAAICLLVGAMAAGQTAPAPKPLMAEDVFKNVQVLKGMSVSEFMGTMGFFAASLDANCTHCHELGSWESYAKDNPSKQMARQMLVMVNTINRTYFGGRQELTCYSCHRFGQKPKKVPSLTLQYSVPIEEEPEEIAAQAPGQPTPDQVLTKYFQALGGAQKVAAVASITAKGTWQGYEDTEQHPLELYAKSPGQRTVIVHNRSGDTVNTYDGRNAWTVAPETDVPVTFLQLFGPELDNAKVDAELSFPARIKDSLTQLRVGGPITIGDSDVTVLQGLSAGNSPVKLFFDSDTGLLLRMVRYTDLKVGRIPTQFDYSDYRDVNGVKIPFHWVTTWTDGRSITQLTDLQLNATIDAAKFAKPKAPSK